MLLPLFQFQLSQGPIKTTHELFFYSARVADDVMLIHRMFIDYIKVCIEQQAQVGRNGPVLV